MVPDVPVVPDGPVAPDAPVVPVGGSTVGAVPVPKTKASITRFARICGKPGGGGASAKVDRVDREQPAGRVELAVAHVDEVAQPVEEVGQVVEVALELDRDRHRP